MLHPLNLFRSILACRRDDLTQVISGGKKKSNSAGLSGLSKASSCGYINCVTEASVAHYRNSTQNLNSKLEKINMLCLDFSFTIFGNISQRIQEGIKTCIQKNTV